ncbi:hypothetical protein LIA77_01274 [Sarocladium implicatum]|nr:hypothetical protein LIA77_01274 [Sarocladium implicatum]
MPLRASAQCRQTLARAPASTPSNVWITDRMLFEAFQRYSLSSVRSTASDARCVHFNAGPLEHRRRAGKRRMTAVLPVSRLELPAWFLPVAQDESPLKWWPPTNPTERHTKKTKSGVLNDIIAWLEDYPPPKPFITPPIEELFDSSSAESQALGTNIANDAIGASSAQQGSQSSYVQTVFAGVAAAEAASSASPTSSHNILGETASLPAAQVIDPLSIPIHQDRVDATNLMASLREDLSACPHDFESLSRVLPRYDDAVARCVLQGDFHSQALCTLLDPFNGEHNIASRIPPLLVDRILAQWQGRVLSVLRTTNWTRPEALDRSVWVEATKLLCQPRIGETSSGSAPHESGHHRASVSSDRFASWCSTLRNLTLLVMEMRPQHRKYLRVQMNKYLSTQASVMDSPMTVGLGWAIVLLNNHFEHSQVDFDKFYQDSIGNDQNQHRDAQTFYLVMSQLCRNQSLPYQGYVSIFEYHNEKSRWAALLSTLASLRSEAVALGQQARSLLSRMDYLDEMSGSVRLQPIYLFERCDEGLAIVMDNHRVALQLHESRQILHAEKSRNSARQAWSYKTWALYIHTMIKDPQIPITHITDCICSLGHRTETKAPRLDQAEREGRARLLEEMSHTLAYDAPNFRPWRIWKELSLWNQLYYTLMRQGKYSPKISNIMMDITVSRLQRGEVVKPSRINFLAHMVRGQVGEEQAKAFKTRVLSWQKQNKGLGTSEQLFPLRFRPQQSAAELEMVERMKALEGSQEQHLEQTASDMEAQPEEESDELVEIVSSLRI